MPSTTPTPTVQECPTVVLDALPRLGVRARRHALPGHDAAPGRYLVLEGDGDRVLLPVGDGVTHLGRGFSADVQLEDQSVSRRHAILHLRGGCARILDDRSANGTYVNGRRVSEAELRDGDVLVLGRVVLTYRDLR